MLEWLMGFGYAGIFLSSFIGSASVLLPLPSFALVFAAGALLNPFGVGLAAGAGAALGELTSYGIGYGGKLILEKKRKDFAWLKKAGKWMNKVGGFALIFVFAATPLPDDIIGIVCGSIKYDIKKFILATLLGKIVLSMLLAFGGYYGLAWVTKFAGL